MPDLATGWSWNEDGTELTFPLRQGVKWHDGKPFTAKDVQCTWDLLTGKSSDEAARQSPQILVPEPRAGHHQRRLRGHLSSEAAAAGLSRRCSPPGISPIYPCHVPPREMRSHPIGTGPFKFVEFKPNEYIKVTRNPDYWKPGRPYLDGIEYTIITQSVDGDIGVRRRQVRHDLPV